MELWDGYKADRTLAGIDIAREDEQKGNFPKGLYHLVADVIVKHTDGTYLAMQRDFNKIGFPGEWEIGAGGSVLKGETAYEGALRELREGTGIIAEKLTSLKTISMVCENGVGVHYYMYLCITDMNKDAVILQEGETIDHKWVTDEEMLAGSFIPKRCTELVEQLFNKHIIKTDRLLLRPLCTDDLGTVHLYASDRNITRYMMNLPNDTVEESLKFIGDAVCEWNKPFPEFYEYAVVLDDVQIGGVCLYFTEDRKQGELGWILNPDYHGKGFASEAAKAMISLAEHLGLEEVFARCDSRNKASEKVMQRLGMTLEYADGTRYYEKKNETAGELKYILKLK